MRCGLCGRRGIDSIDLSRWHIESLKDGKHMIGRPVSQIFVEIDATIVDPST
jgi:hypothetical protein